jgi:hypothetical protein
MDPYRAAWAFRVEMDGGEVVESDGVSLVLTMPPARTHGLAHLDEWAAAVRPLLGPGGGGIGSVLEDGAAALGDPRGAVLGPGLGAR